MCTKSSTTQQQKEPEKTPCWKLLLLLPLYHKYLALTCHSIHPILASLASVTKHESALCELIHRSTSSHQQLLNRAEVMTSKRQEKVQAERSPGSSQILSHLDTTYVYIQLCRKPLLTVLPFPFQPFRLSTITQIWLSVSTLCSGQNRKTQLDADYRIVADQQQCLTPPYNLSIHATWEAFLMLTFLTGELGQQ